MTLWSNAEGVGGVGGENEIPAYCSLYFILSSNILSLEFHSLFLTAQCLSLKCQPLFHPTPLRAHKSMSVYIHLI